ncbi:hypothetical protein [Novosphingobium sp.]|uniref:dCTP deaminase domain-containing protein n=1 Tax=Novosphingobium sp. TaxID=1874826 RepID=UPI00260011AE|nr:hypothetical protein [Novosphingobium sp.]MCC6927289.1 hypothetical protein [Novosphingobium sp.]
MAGTGSRRLVLGDEEFLDARDYLKLEMVRQNINAQELATQLGMSPQAIYNVTGETRRPISHKLARGLAQVLGGTVEFWLASKFPNVSRESVGPDPIPATPRPGVLIDQEIKKWNAESEDDGFVISPLNEDKVKGASLDLSVGLIVTKGFFQVPKRDRDAWFHFYQMDATPEAFGSAELSVFAAMKADLGIEFSDEIDLQPGQSVHVVAAEMVQMGPRFFCAVGNVNELNLRGIQVLCGSQIDPGFKGPLVFLVKNILEEGAVRLSRGDDIASLTVYSLRHAVGRLYAENRLSQIGALVGKLRRALFAESERSSGNAVLHEIVEALRHDKTGLNKLLDRNQVEARAAIWSMFKAVPVDVSDIEALAEYLAGMTGGDKSDPLDVSAALAKAPLHLAQAIREIASNPDQEIAYSEAMVRALIDLA